MNILTLQDVDFRYGGLKAVSGFSMHIAEGSITSLIGPNGAGKTTIFNLIAGVLRPDKGEIIFQNKPIHRLPPHRIAALGMARTFQNIKLFERLSVKEHLDLAQHLKNESTIFSEIFGLSAAARDKTRRNSKTKEILDFLGLSGCANLPAASLPYGLQRRVEFARALATGARLLLLDEPAAGMNIGETADMTRLIRRIADTGITVLLVEHDMRVVMNISDKVWVINYGQVIATGTPQEVRRNSHVVSAYLGETETT
ncbi:MAG: ABC transporter ATP-binding protein [Spirochaetales bacterium]|jgi:branched-chain amino acid transport system ATP-binding protein|nr:ABC transporter ATP-binding protein [Spirochaetales bacterium]